METAAPSGSASSGDTVQSSSDIQPQTAQHSYSGTKHKVKISNEEREVPYEELVSNYQLKAASDQKFQQASEIRKQVDQIVETIKSGDHKKLVALVGKDQAKKLAESLLLEEIEWEELPEHEKKFRELAKQKEELENRVKSQEEKQQEQLRHQAKQQAITEIDTEIGEVLQELGRKPTPRLIARIAEEMLISLDAKGERLPAKKAMQKTIDQMWRDLSEFLEHTPPDEVRSRLPKKLLDGLRRADVETVTGKFNPRQTADSKPQEQVKRKKKLTTEEWFKNMDKKLGGR